MVFEFFVAGLPQIARVAGAEFLIYDMEHSGTGFETVKAQCLLARGAGVAPIVRVPGHDYDFIARALDCGAAGVMVPLVRSAAQAAAIVQRAKYPPRGQRGAAFSVAHDGYAAGDPRDKVRAADEGTMLIAMVETADGIAQCEAIAATPGIDALWLGHFDLTNSMGIPGAFEHPDYRAACARLVRAARAAGKAAGFMAADERWACEYWQQGFRMIAYGLDHLLYQRALGEGLRLLAELAGRGR